MILHRKLNNIKNFLIDYRDSAKRLDKVKAQYNYENLKKVRISCLNTAFDKFIRLQTKQQLGVCGNTAFITAFNPDINLIVNKRNPFIPLSSNTDKNWLLHIEPPGYIKKLDMANDKKVKNYSRVYTSAPELFEKGGRFIASPPFVHWHLAVSSYTTGNNMIYDFDFLRGNTNVPQKEASLVAINSSINDLPGHKLRADFITMLCEKNLKFDLYGSTIWSKYKQYKNDAPNGKWPVYSRSKYVLVIENEVSPYYWSEKFTDAVLCYSMPIYYGSPKIGEYFPEGSYITIDIKKASAFDDLQDILNSDYYEKNIHKLIEARHLILTKYNMFNFIDHEIYNLH